MKKVLVFGSFDGIHEGHRALFKEAKKYGDYLIAVVSQDHVIESLKGHLPKFNVAERVAHLEEEDGVDEVVIGDGKLSGYEVVKKYQPEVIAIGYDQDLLKEDIEKHYGELGYAPAIVVMASFEPNIYHSSLLNE